jgi:hypothetical protein
MSGDTEIEYGLELTTKNAKFFLSMMEDGFYAGVMQRIVSGEAVDRYTNVQRAAYLLDSTARQIWTQFKQYPEDLFENAAPHQLLERTPNSILVYLLEGESNPQLSSPIR